MFDVMPRLLIIYRVCVCVVFVRGVCMSEVMPGWLSIFLCYRALGEILKSDKPSKSINTWLLKHLCKEDTPICVCVCVNVCVREW